MGKWNRRALLALAVGIALQPGAVRAVEQDGRLWTTLVASKRNLGVERLSGALMLQTRLSNDMADLERLLIRPWIGYAATERFAVAVGYDAHLVWQPVDREEHRIWQQASLATPVADLRVDHRLRLEQRFGDLIDGAAVRLRYLVAATLPILPKLEGVVRNELFFNLNGPSPLLDPGLGENRAFAGARFPLNRTVVLELGYQVQWIRIPRLADRLNHTLMTGVALSF